MNQLSKERAQKAKEALGRLVEEAISHAELQDKSSNGIIEDSKLVSELLDDVEEYCAHSIG